MRNSKTHPYHPCMVYLHTNQPNVGQYTIHGCYMYGICIPGTCEFVLYFKGCVFHPPHEGPNSLHSKQRVESCGNVGSRFLHSTSPGLAGRSSKPAVEINHSRVCYQKKISADLPDEFRCVNHRINQQYYICSIQSRPPSI